MYLIMSVSPSIELVPMSSHSDSSAQTVPLVEPPVEPPVESPEDTPTEPPEKDADGEADADADAEAEDEEDEKPSQQQKEDNDLAAVALGSILVLGGMILGGLALYMNTPLVIEHPWSRGDYF